MHVTEQPGATQHQGSPAQTGRPDTPTLRSGTGLARIHCREDTLHRGCSMDGRKAPLRLTVASSSSEIVGVSVTWSHLSAQHEAEIQACAPTGLQRSQMFASS